MTVFVTLDPFSPAHRPENAIMVNSVIKAIKIMQLFDAGHPRMTLAEISRRLDMPKSTVHNLLTTLRSQGFIEKVDGAAYAVGTEPVALSQRVRVNIEVRDPAAPLLRKLADACRESVYLTIWDGDYALYIYAIESSHRLQARTAVGDRAPLHCTSVGKAILAWLPSHEVDEIVGRAGLTAFTENTITELDVLHDELSQTRSRGYALDASEHEVDAYCIGAPILDRRGRVIGACSISGRDMEIVGRRRTGLAADVTETALEISRRMGYMPDLTHVRQNAKREDVMRENA